MEQEKKLCQGKATIAYNNLLGYKKGEDGNPVVIDSEAEVVKFIYNNYLAGDSMTVIKNKLEQNQMQTKKGNIKWTNGAIRTILKNEKYVGDVIMQKTYVVDCISKRLKLIMVNCRSIG